MFIYSLKNELIYTPYLLIHSMFSLKDKKLDKITAGLRGKTFNVEGRRDACENLVKYLWETRGMHNAYAIK